MEHFSVFYIHEHVVKDMDHFRKHQTSEATDLSGRDYLLEHGIGVETSRVEAPDEETARDIFMQKYPQFDQIRVLGVEKYQDENQVDVQDLADSPTTVGDVEPGEGDPGKLAYDHAPEVETANTDTAVHDLTAHDEEVHEEAPHDQPAYGSVPNVQSPNPYQF